MSKKDRPSPSLDFSSSKMAEHLAEERRLLTEAAKARAKAFNVLNEIAEKEGLAEAESELYKMVGYMTKSRITVKKTFTDGVVKTDNMMILSTLFLGKSRTGNKY